MPEWACAGAVRREPRAELHGGVLDEGSQAAPHGGDPDPKRVPHAAAPLAWRFGHVVEVAGVETEHWEQWVGQQVGHPPPLPRRISD